ncbi:unnamed protein product [Triticum turgidum subsp. durum]|uniref:Homeobox domain-containing protein n=1 Tax=Triticum turgidum subsp. durum TaxID=4567 RepID=A0A9R1BQM4_TRITD|nr:unnamed protein product [Triticum turgidum subsp. durum]
MATDLEKEQPGYGVESARNVKLEEHTRGAHVVELTSGLLDEDEIVMNSVSRDEGVVVGGHHGVKARGEAERQDLGEKLCKEATGCEFEALVQTAEGIGIRGLGVPCLRHHLLKAIELQPKAFELGLDAMNTCFFGGSSMIGSEAPFFYPGMPHDAGFGSGGADVAAHFMASSAMVTSPANQLVWPAAAPSQDSHQASMSTEEMNDDAYAVAGESCSTVHSMLPSASADFFQYGSGVVTIAQPSKMAKLVAGEPHCGWLYDGPSAASTHQPYYLTAFSGGSDFPDAVAGAASGLSLRLGAQSSSVTMASIPEQSSEVSCSGLTHVNSEGFGYQQPQAVRAHAGAGAGLFHLPPYGDVGAGDDELRHVYPQMYSRPPHFSQVLPRSGYAHIAQELLNGFAGCVLKDLAEMPDDSVSGIGSEASLLLSSSCSARTPSSVSSNQLMLPSDEGSADGGRWMEAQRQLRRGDQQSWRPQRGLPEKSVAVLKAWMFENFLRPYPKDHEKDMLAARSGLSRSQVSNWFINARVRLWKPMIEEMYEELKRSSGRGGDAELPSSKDVVG